jgi:hypothetical protein
MRPVVLIVDDEPAIRKVLSRNGTDGPDLAKLLRLLQPGLTVLFTTGYGEGEQERVPRDPLLPKPFPPAKVAQCVRDLVATGRCECCARLAGGM